MAEAAAGSKRLANFDDLEVSVLLDYVFLYKDALFRKFDGFNTTKISQDNIWEEITCKMHSQFPHVKRMVVKYKKKWSDLKTASKPHISAYMKSPKLTG